MRRDFEKYLTLIQKQWTEMNKAVEEANKLIAEGKMTQDTANYIRNMMEVVNTNYQRLMYCRYLYNLPPKFIQKILNKKLTKEAKKFAEENSDAEAVEKENKEAIDNIKEEVSNGSDK